LLIVRVFDVISGVDFEVVFNVVFDVFFDDLPVILIVVADILKSELCGPK
jgi:hypothetical protein